MIQNEARLEKIRTLLQSQLSPTKLVIEDESDQHLGHSGAEDGRGHFNVTILSDCFEGKSLIERHKMVYQALGTMMEEDIHALSIKAMTPNQ